MKHNKIFVNTLTSALTALFLGLGVMPEAKGQAAASDTALPADSVVMSASEDDIERQVWDAIYATEGYEEMAPDALLPITKEQAEELITQLILEARKPYVEAHHRDSVLTAFKVETLRRRALDQALARTYTEPLERRLDQMERLLYALLLSRGDLDPTVINHLLAGSDLPGSYVIPAQNLAAQGETPGHQSTSTNDRVKKPLTPGRIIDPEEAIALKPGLDSKEIELYMSVAYFDFDSSKIKGESAETLDNVAAWMKENDLRISLRGYASPEGKMSYNNKLSGRRVNAVADYLVGKGVPRDRLEVIPSGIDSMKDTKSKYPLGRRVEIRPILY